MIKKLLIFLLLLILSLTLTACWGKRELNEIGIVRATGIDVEPDGKVRVTIISIEPTGKPSSGGGQEKPNSWIGTATGLDIADADKSLRGLSAKNLAWFQNKLIIISEEAARKELKDIIDFFARNREIRYDSKVLISHERAENIMQVPSGVESNLPTQIEGLILNADAWSGTHVSSMKDIMVALSERSVGIVTGRLGVYETSGKIVSASSSDSEKQGSKNSKLPIVFLEGSAAFKQDKMVGWMDAGETRGYEWIANVVKMETITTKDADGKATISLDIESSKSDILAKMTDDKIIMNVKLKIKGRLAGQTNGGDIMDEVYVKKVENAFSETVVNDMKAATRKAQEEYDTDIFGFGGYVNRKYPKEWKKIEKDWDKIFPKVEVRYEVKVILKRLGETGRTIISAEDENDPLKKQ